MLLHWRRHRWTSFRAHESLTTMNDPGQTPRGLLGKPVLDFSFIEAEHRFAGDVMDPTQALVGFRLRSGQGRLDWTWWPPA